MHRSADTVDRILKSKGSEVWSVGPEQSVYEAIEIMAERSVGALVVLHNGTLAGVISERDYARRVILQGRSSRSTCVREIMTSPVVFVTLQHSLDECMSIMTKCRIRHLPVVDHNVVVGVLSIGDLVRWLLWEQEGTIQQLETYIAGSYPS